MVDVGMGQENIIHIGKWDGEICVFIYISSLFHTIVYEDMSAAGFQVMTAAGYFVVSADEGYFHTFASLHVFGENLTYFVSIIRKSKGCPRAYFKITLSKFGANIPRAGRADDGNEFSNMLWLVI